MLKQILMLIYIIVSKTAAVNVKNVDNSSENTL